MPDFEAPKRRDRGPMQLVWPAIAHLDSYVQALERGWSPDNLRPEAGREELTQIWTDPLRFLDGLVDREGKGALVLLPDGTAVPRLPGYRRWMWDGAFCGSIALRWQPGTDTLPVYCLGHIGYSVVPWRQGRGHATQALHLLLRDAPREGLCSVDITTSPDNLGSQRVIRANGGRLIERFDKSADLGGTPELRFRIDL